MAQLCSAKSLGPSVDGAKNHEKSRYMIPKSKGQKTFCNGQKYGKGLATQLFITMVAKNYGHKNVITKSKQKNGAYFGTIPFFVK